MSEGELFDTLDIIVLGAIALCGIAYLGLFRSGSTNQPVSTQIQLTTSQVNEFFSDSFVDVMETNNKDMIVFYGSQTGTAEDFSSRLVAEAPVYGFNALLADIEEYDLKDLERPEMKDKLIVLCIATYGEGDPTDNAIDFFQYLKDDVDPDELEGIKYTVFSLGNSTYEHYQAAGRLVDQVFADAGGIPIYERGEGNDDANIEDDFSKWKKGFWPAACSAFDRECPDDAEGHVLARQYTMAVHSANEKINIKTGEIGATRTNKVADAKNPVLVPVTKNIELFKSDTRSCRHIELDITNVKMSYQAGDHVGIYPANPVDYVDRLGKALDTDLDTIVSLCPIDTGSGGKDHFPGPCSIRTALTHYLDIAQLPKPHQLRVLAEYAEAEDQERLLFLSSEEGHDEYNKYVIEDMRSFAEVIEDFKTLKPPVDHILEILPRLQCRYYSISSSPKLNSNSIHVTAVVVDYQTPLGRHGKGICTTYLKDQLVENAPEVLIFVRHSTFRLPKDRKKSVIMIGPGTGIAPFRGFLQDRHYHCQKREEMGETILYFGCRRRDEDYLYEDELIEFQQKHTLSQLHLAFSREQEEKVYVTHLLKKNREEIWDLLENGAYLYICGDGKSMARDVHAIIEEVIMDKQKTDSTGANKYIKKLQDTGRYLLDVW